VDDLEESDSEDIKQVGKFCYVSCWTKDADESIPMWNMYTPNMQGVRIRLTRNPFKQYHYSKGEFFFDNDTSSYIDYKKLYQEDKVYISPDSPTICDVEYTNDDKKIYPKIKNVVEKLESTSDGKEIWLKEVEYSFQDFGKYKRKSWEFQSETRYIIIMFPFSKRELNESKNFYEGNELTYRIEDSKIKAPYERFFLELSEEAFDNLEILLAPRVTEAQEEMVKLMVNKYCPKARVVKSKLKIR